MSDKISISKREKKRKRKSLFILFFHGDELSRTKKFDIKNSDKLELKLTMVYCVYSRRYINSIDWLKEDKKKKANDIDSICSGKQMKSDKNRSFD